jgi:hypothetical protein
VDVTNGPTGQIGDYYPTAICKNGSIVLGETGGNSDGERTLSLGGAIVRAGGCETRGLRPRRK